MPIKPRKIPKKFKEMSVTSKHKWTEWITPKQKGYLMKCCGCGLIHELEFRAYIESYYKKEKTATIMPEEIKAMFRARYPKLKK